MSDKNFASMLKPVPNTLFAPAPTDRYAIEYNMNHKFRGLGIIFNHENFLSNDKREGTNKDCADLQKTLTNLGFKVDIYSDYTMKDIKKTLENVAAQDFSDSDCIAVTLLTHGEKGGFVHAKDEMYLLDLMFLNFTSDKCRTLAGKPKIFFIQACRGDQTDSGIELRPQTQTESTGFCDSYRIPIIADFFIAYSTVSDHLSFRSPTRGSFFIQELCKELNLNGKKYDINTLFTFINQNIAINYTTGEACDREYQNKKQMSCFTSTLTRILIFKDKN
ncbi:caspase-like isoform X2 [Calliphora vicina]|uniref:caspase-like isoform X2 n=1 Tax=Calliphora vicina TaxID=7373 RepID=UPI00325B3892